MTTLTLQMIVRARDQATPVIAAIAGGLRAGMAAVRAFNAASSRGLVPLGREVVRTARPAIAALGAMRGEALSLLRTVAKIGLTTAGLGYGFKRLFVDAATDAERFRLVLEGTEQSPGRADSALHWMRRFKDLTGYELAEIRQAWVDFRRDGLNPISGAFNRIADAAAGNGLTFERTTTIWREALAGNVGGLEALGIKAEKVGDRIVLKYDHLGQTIRKTVAANDKAAIAQALGFIVNEKWGGFAERHAKTLPAMWSNAKQSFSDFAQTVMDNGVFDAIKDVLADINARLAAARADGSLQRWAREAAVELKELLFVVRDVATFLLTWMPRALRWIREQKDAAGGWTNVLIGLAALLGLRMVAAVLKFLATLWPLAKAIFWLATGIVRLGVLAVPLVIKAFTAFAGFVTATLIPAIVKLGAAFLATPVGWIVLALAAIGAAAWLLYENWSAVWRFLDSDTGQAVQVLLAVLAPLWYVPMRIIRSWEPLKAFFSGLWGDITGAFDRAVAWIEKKWADLKAVVDAIRSAFDTLNPFGSGGGSGGSAPGGPTFGRPAPVLGSTGGAALGGLLAPRPQQVDGEVRIVVEAKDGTDAKLAGARASGGVDVTATLGQYGRFL